MMNTKCQECQFDNPADTKFCGNCGTPLPPLEDSGLAKTLALDTPVTRLERGTVFAQRYEVIEELGKGGMGSVYRVLDRKINEEVALKLIRPEIVDDETLERFSNELKYTRKIAHRNVCKMYDLGEDRGTHFLTMEYVPGEDLKSMIKMTQQLGVRTAIYIAKQVSEGLAEAHRLGIVHRDLKPSNIIIDKEGHVRIMDFGIARSLKKDRRTAAGILMGTPEYMSPEQAEAKEADHRSDIYSLGVILFEMLTGRVPFEGETPLGIAVKHKTESPPDPQTINPDIPDDLSLVVLKCLTKDREQRYQDARELLHDLTEVEESLPATDRTGSKKKPITSREITVKFNLKKLFLPTIILLTVIVIGAIGWKYFFERATGVTPEDMLTVAVITFENLTGDSNYNYLQDAIPNLLITSLEQSKYFRVTSWERLRDLLKQLGKEGVRVIDRDLGFELCRMDGIQAIVLGSFTKAENMFATDVKVLDVETKATLKSVSSRGEGVDSILKRQIDELSSEVSRSIGVPERTTMKKASPIVEFMTDSMEAYNYFLRGREDYEKFYFNDARRFLERAVELDPEFSMAYFYLARVHNWLGNPVEMKEAMDKFKKYGKKLEGKEGMYVQAVSAGEEAPEKYVEGLKEIIKRYPKEKRFRFDLAVYYYRQRMHNEAIEELIKTLELDPEFGSALNYLAYLYSDMKDYDKALEYFQKYAAVSPGDANPFDSMGETYFRMGKLDESAEKFKEVLEVKPDFGSDWKIAFIYALREDYLKTMKWIDQFISMAPTEPIKALGHLWKGYFLYLQGRIDECQTAVDKAKELAWKAQNLQVVDMAHRIRIWVAYDWEEYERFMDLAKDRFDFRRENNYGSEKDNQVIYTFYLGIYDVKKDRVESARTRLSEIQSLLSQMKEEEARGLQAAHDLLSSEIHLAEGSVEEAIEDFKKVPVMEMIFSVLTSGLQKNLPFLDDFYARAYVKKGELDKAIAEYKNLLTFNPEQALVRDLIPPLGRFRLARLLEEKGLKQEAAEQYETLLGAWENADQDLKLIQEAKKRFEALQNN